jgi:multiple sugar transport system ATP-binding protein
MRGELKRLHRRLATTTIYVTHDQEEAMTLGDRIVVMRDGRIQQADTPLNTYNHPVNRFVAGFIGVPPMNFFDGLVKEIDGRLVFEEGRLGRSNGLENASSGEEAELTLPGNGFTLGIPAHLTDAVSALRGRHIVLGIRPEHLRLRPVDEEGMSAALDVRLSMIEPLGDNMDVYVETSLHDRVVARVEARSGLQVGSQAHMYVALRKIHCFEPGVTGMNLSLTSEPAHAV